MLASDKALSMPPLAALLVQAASSALDAECAACLGALALGRRAFNPCAVLCMTRMRRFVNRQMELMETGVERKEAFRMVEAEFAQQR